MKTSNKILLGAFILILVSATVMMFIVKANLNGDPGNMVTGNKQVITQTRDVQNFQNIEAKGGIKLKLEQGSAQEVKVEADENLIDLITTEVRNNKLYVSLKKSIRQYEALNVYVTFDTLNSLTLQAGVQATNEGTLQFGNLDMNVSSGAGTDMNLFAENLSLNVSSGSNVTLSGKTNDLRVDNSSGAIVNASQLEAAYCHANSSSGANTRIWVTKECSIDASSGGRIKYAGSPQIKDMNISSGGSVSHQE